jgi:hypothetical protein
MKLITQGLGKCRVTFGGFCTPVVFNHRFSYMLLTARTHACQKNRRTWVQFGRMTSGPASKFSPFLNRGRYQAPNASFTSLKIVRRFWATTFTHARRPI